ncbi:MAG: hypothetical protein KAI06_11245 [Anaerolineales bacterium]|nr:hypothetical protein [Anaerolineales bacterium]
MASRFGSALILIGLISIVVFILTLQIHQPNTLALLLGASLTALGLVIRRSAARNAQRRTARFQTLRRLRGDRHKIENLDE